MITTTSPRLWIFQIGTVTVPTGYQSDGFTIPTLLRPLAALLGITPEGQYSECAVLHDFICETHQFWRPMCDDLFRQALRQQGCPWFKRWILYKSVRLGAKMGY
jgi:hypothetical protein